MSDPSECPQARTNAANAVVLVDRLREALRVLMLLEEAGVRSTIYHRLRALLVDAESMEARLQRAAVHKFVAYLEAEHLNDPRDG